MRRTPADGGLVTISAADPLNLAGIVTAGERVRAASRRRIVYRDGMPLAVADGDGLRELTPLDPSLATDVARVLKARPATALALRLGPRGGCRPRTTYATRSRKWTTRSVSNPAAPGS